tara:strand:+ start:320 stop:1798 length:1479 start_codon:yes stop_codon:yes gene_type:complete
VTGQHLFNTFLGTVVVQGVLGIFSVLLVYRILFPISRIAAMVSAVVYVLSMVPFTAAKLMLDAQLFAFMVLLTIYCLSLYLSTRQRIFILLTVVSGLVTMFTRWEGQFLLIVVSITLLVVGWSERSRLFVYWCALLGIIVVTLTAWSGTRAVYMNDPRVFGTLQNGTGEQLFWRLYSHFNNRAYQAKIHFDPSFLGEVFDGEGGRTKHFKLVLPENGPATKALQEFIRHVATSRPAEEIFNSHLISGLEGGYLTRLGGIPDRLIDEIFMSPNITESGKPFPPFTYAHGVPMELRREIGAVDADKFLMKVHWETIRNEPFVLVPMVVDAMSMLGIRFQKNAEGGFGDTRWLFSGWGRAHYLNVGFNLGNCANISLPSEMMAEYRWDYGLNEHRPYPSYAVVASAGRNILRNVIGPLALLTWWFMPFSRFRPLLLAVGLSSMCLVAVPAFLGGGAYTRYEIPLLPLLLIGCTGSIVAIRDVIASGRLRRLMPWL